MRRIAQAPAVGGAVIVAAALLAGCGGGSPKRSAAGVADCLNAQGFLVEATGNRIDGTAPSGVSLTLTIRSGTPSLLATSFGPTPSALTRSERTEVVSCLQKRGPAPGTLTAPAAR